MDSAMIELSSNVDLVSGQMDDAVGTPMLMKISPDMLPVMAVSYTHLDVYKRQLLDRHTGWLFRR